MQQEWSAGDGFQAAVGIGQAAEQAPPVVNHTARHHPALLQVVGGEATPTPLVLGLVEPIFGVRAIGIVISKRQVVRLLNADTGPFVDEARAVLRAGLETAPWISVDDTGARHRHQNGYCTQVGNDHFAAFTTTASKSRLNFLEVLRADYRDYVINAEALAYMRRRALVSLLSDDGPLC